VTDLANLARTGDLDDKRVTGYLDSLDVPELTAVLNAPEVRTTIFTIPGGLWSPGQPRPGLADEDPAVMAAIARCAMSRWRGSHVFGDLAVTETHPERCGWCDYPAEELQRALEWGHHYGRFITDESYVWTRGRAIYRRASGRAGRYENGRWAAFDALSPKEQRYQVDRAVEQSRANLAPDPALRVKREHPPWCDLRDDHDGECPEPPE
jgi:hypothetical protein